MKQSVTQNTGQTLLDTIQIMNHFTLRYRLFHVGGYLMTSGLVLVPVTFGIGMIFYNNWNPIGWCSWGIDHARLRCHRQHRLSFSQTFGL